MTDMVVEGIPCNFEEMFRKYGPLIANEIRRHNVVAAHFEDHYQSVCEKLIAAQVITKFKERVLTSVDDDKPRTMTAKDACALLKTSFPAFRAKLVAYHEVFKGTLKGKIPAKITVSSPIDAELLFTYSVKGAVAQGVSCGDDGFKVLKGSTAVEGFAPNLTPGYIAKKKSLVTSGILTKVGGLLVFGEDVLFNSPSAAAGVVYGNNANGRELFKTEGGTSLKEVEAGAVPMAVTPNQGVIKHNGKDLAWASEMPTPIEGHYTSPKAVYLTSDVLDIPHGDYFGKNTFDIKAWPPRKVQPHHFQAYLLRAVRNHFSNACRTIMRRHKDRPGDCFPQFKSPDGEYNTNWEDALPDPSAQSAFRAVEASHDLENAFDQSPDSMDHYVPLDRACVMTSEQKGEISELLKSHTIIEAVRMSSSLTTDQKKTLLSIAEG